MLYQKVGSNYVAWTGSTINNINHPTSIEFYWSANELAAIGLYIPHPADSVPAGKYVISTSVQFVDPFVKYVNLLGDETDPMIQLAKNNAYQSIVELGNVLTGSILNSYPEGEKQLWLAKEAEARAFMAKSIDTRLATDAPILSAVCNAQYGTLDDTTLLTNITNKATTVIAKANQWVAISTFVEGFRSKYDILIAACTSTASVSTTIQTATTELMAVKQAFGL
jgi:hypothetical protein